MKRTITMVWMTLMVSMFACAQMPMAACKMDTVGGQAVYHYQVEKSIGLWRISQNFMVSQEEIIRLNPQLRERGLHVDEIILIPVNERNRVTEPAAQETPVVPAAPEIPESPAVPEAPAEDTVAVADTLPLPVVPVLDSTAIRLALLLPLQAGQTQRDQSVERFFDFYEGALLAIKDIENEGQSLDVYVYDIDKTDIRLEQIIAEGKLDSMHAIIGPAYPMQVNHIAAFCEKHAIPTLIPFSDNVPEIEKNPNLIQFNVSNHRKAVAMADYLQQKGDEVHCILIQARDADIPSSVLELRREIMGRGIPYTQTSIRTILNDSLPTVLKDGVENVLIFNTEKYGNLQMLMPHVLSAKNGKNITLLSQYSWQKEKILLPQLYVSVFGTETERDMTHYNAMFEQYFATTLSSTTPRYDLLGYDMVRQMVALLQGTDYQGLQSEMKLERVGAAGGLMNMHVQIVRK